MQQSTLFFIGIDVSKPWFDASLMEVKDHQKQTMKTERFDNSPAGIKTFHKWLISDAVTFDKNSLVVIENTGVYHRLIWHYCSKEQLPIHIGNAAHIKWSLGITRGKSDVVDSKRLCIYAYKQADELKASPVLDPVFMQLKDLMTARSALVKQLNGMQNYLKELKSSPNKALQQVIEKAHRQALEGIKKSIKNLEEQIQKIIVADESIYKNYQLIKSVPGIGHLTAIYLLCCTNNFAGKISGKQLASYAGVVPFEHSSGISIKGRSRVHKMANKELKKMLHLCALVVLRYSPEFKQYFQRKKAEGKNGMSVLNAIRNKLILRVVAVVNKQQPYVENLVKAA
jgi:transposase